MSDPVYPVDPETLRIESSVAKEIGAQLASQYQGKTPYDYGCFDNFLPLEILEKVREEALAEGAKDAEHASAHEKLKTSYNPDRLPPYTRAVFTALTGRPFLQFLEELTGIEGLIPDPYFIGGGIHRTESTGYLSIHADFNYHKQMHVERRINVLIYLNPDWTEAYGGSFEVWTDDMSKSVAKFAPVMNRMCCFSTGANTMHGNPDPVNHPNGDPRLSIALYYYTATWDEGRTKQSTVFKARPGSGDARSYDAAKRLANDVLPPIVIRNFNRVKGRVGRLLGK